MTDNVKVIKLATTQSLQLQYTHNLFLKFINAYHVAYLM